MGDSGESEAAKAGALSRHQCVEARRLLRWSQVHLAYVAGVQAGAIGQFERIGRPTRLSCGFDWCEKVRTAFEKFGVDFFDGPPPSVQLWSGYAITPTECAEARRLLGISQVKIGRVVGLTQAQMSDFERTGHMARRFEKKRDRIADLKMAFEKAGVEFSTEARESLANAGRAS